MRVPLLRSSWTLALWLALCIPAAAHTAWGFDWHTHIGINNPLVGRVWEPSQQRFLGPAALVPKLARARFVLLGERHDNPDHHRMQAHLLAGLVRAGRRPAVAFEMIDTAQAGALARFLATSPHRAAALGSAIDWAQTGWPPWRYYAPIAEVALDGGLPIVPAELPANKVRAVVEHGWKPLDASLVARLGLRRPWPASRTAAMRSELRRAHCGLLPAHLLPGMVQAQRLRDAFMAERLRSAATADGAVLIAGAGHARTDYGVPLHLRGQGVRAGQIASVALVEVRPGEATPRAYASSFNAKRLPFDYVIFTPAARHGNTCAKLRRRLRGGSADKPR